MREMINSGLEWLGNVPKEWIVERLQWHIYEINNKNNPVKTTNILSLTNKKGVIPYEEKGAQGNIAKENYSEYRLAYEDTIVANSMNILIGSVGYSHYFGCVSPVYYVFKEKGKTDLHFVNYIMQTTQFQRELRKYANGILEIRMRVSSSDILKRMAAFPSIEEQHKIVKFLDEKCKIVDKNIDDLQKQLELLDKYKRAFAKKITTQGLEQHEQIDSGIPWIGKVPKEWKIDKIKYHLKRCERRNPGGKQVLSVYREYGVIPKDSRDDNYNVTSEDISKYKYVKPGVLVINKMKAWQGSMGVSEFEGVVSPAYFIYEFKDNLIEKKYLHYLLRSCYKDEFRRISGGIRDGQWDLSPSSFEDTKILIPSINEQRKIVEFLDKSFKELEFVIETKQKQLEKMESFKKSLIYEYVTGKKEVPNE